VPQLNVEKPSHNAVFGVFQQSLFKQKEAKPETSRNNDKIFVLPGALKKRIGCQRETRVLQPVPATFASLQHTCFFADASLT